MLGEETVSVIADLVTKGYGVTCFTPVAGSKTEGMTESMVLAKRILAAERRIKLIDIGRMVRIIEFSPDIDVKHAMRRAWRTWRRT